MHAAETHPRRETQKRVRDVRFGSTYLAMLLLSFHWALVAYVNSTYLGTYIDTTAIGTIYTIGSALAIFAFLFISRVLGALGNFKLTIWLLGLEAVALLGIAFGGVLEIVVPLFILHHAIVPLLAFNLDVFVESMSGKDESKTGGRRALLLVTVSIAYALAPLLMGFLLGSDATPRFALVYVVSALILLSFGAVVWRHFKFFKDPPYGEIRTLDAIRRFWLDRNLRFVFLAHFLVQMFFAWSVIYTPLYLATVVGFSWDQIGFILFVGLLAYVIFEYPVGELADRWIGEKEMMAIGFLVLAVATAWMSFIAVAALIPWAITLFISRTGGAFVEATTESYFFKHTSGSDANIISFFRVTRPLSYVAAALIGSLLLLYIPFTYIFLALGGCLMLGIAFALALEDTR